MVLKSDRRAVKAWPSKDLVAYLSRDLHAHSASPSTLLTTTNDDSVQSATPPHYFQTLRQWEQACVYTMSIPGATESSTTTPLDRSTIPPLTPPPSNQKSVTPITPLVEEICRPRDEGNYSEEPRLAFPLDAQGYKDLDEGSKSMSRNNKRHGVRKAQALRRWSSMPIFKIIRVHEP